jgi:hypothetical protein
MEQSFVTVYIVDAFTNELFSGNPAAVCCLENVRISIQYFTLHQHTPFILYFKTLEK